MHKGIQTNPWAAVWNVVMVITIGLSLGFMAEGLTDALGMRFEKISHFQGH
jgi:ABC-type dipeptide/oligopeptide/nickel transport system permease subunit